MTNSEQVLRSFFIRVSQREEMELSSLLDEPEFTVSSDTWSFTLPALHRYLQRRYGIFRKVSYPQFRRLLFHCPINRSINASGAEITIADNQGNTDRSVYALLWKHP